MEVWPEEQAAAQDLFLDTHGVKLGFMSAFVKAASDALQKVAHALTSSQSPMCHEWP